MHQGCTKRGGPSASTGVLFTAANGVGKGASEGVNGAAAKLSFSFSFPSLVRLAFFGSKSTDLFQDCRSVLMPIVDGGPLENCPESRGPGE